MQLTLVLMNERLRAQAVDEIEAFLESEKVFEVPCVNRRASDMAGTWEVNGAHSVGDTTIAVTPGTGTPHINQIFRFNNRMKLYRVKSFAGT